MISSATQSDLEQGAYSVPVLMYHTVGPAFPRWPWPWLTTPTEVFNDQVEAMARAGYAAIGLEDLYAYMKDGKGLPGRAVILTFDDGYLDNYVYAYPILKKHGFKGTVFMSTDFVDPSPVPRQTLEDVWAGRISQSDLPGPGFLSWPEMKLMEQSGVIEVQSHTITHTWSFTGPRIVDFHSPESKDKYPWLMWNARPDLKYRYLSEDQSPLIPYGTPVYENRRALGGIGYRPDPALSDYLLETVAASGGDEFFRRPGWKDDLLKHAESFREKHGERGSFESQDEYMARARHELAESKRAIEENLGHEVRFLCWPGGGRTPDVERLALDVGYVATTKSGSAMGKTPNAPGADPTWLNRIGCQDAWYFRGRKVAYTDGRYLLSRLEVFQGNMSHLWALRMRKIGWLIGSYLLGRRP